MGFNGSGSYTLAEAPFVPNTPISSAAVNSDLSDIATNGLSLVVCKDGQTTITGPFKGANGSVGLPMYSFASDTNNGVYRKAADELGFSTAGTLAGYFGTDQKLNLSTGLIVVGTVAVPAKSVALASLADGTANRLYGTDGSGVFSAITPSTGLVLSGSTLTAVAQLGRGYMDGCITSNGTDATNDINFAAGVCRDSTNAVNITLPTLAGKQLDANWAVGANAGMRNSAVGIANGTYGLYAVATAAGVISGTADIYAYASVAGTNPDSSASITAVLTALQAESSGSSYIYARRVASIVRGGASILAYTQYGNDFIYVNVQAEINNSAPVNTSAQTLALTVPVGLILKAYVNTVTNAGAAARVSSLVQTDFLPATGSGATVDNFGGGAFAASANAVYTNASAQIRYRMSIANAVSIGTEGYMDQRGQNA